METLLRIQHIRGYHEYYVQDESWKNDAPHHEGPEAWEEADKAQRDMLLVRVVPYMGRDSNRTIGRDRAGRPGSPAHPGETLTPGTDRLFQRGFGLCKGVPPASQSGQYHLPDAAQLGRLRPELAGPTKIDRGRAGTGGRRCRADGGGICRLGL